MLGKLEPHHQLSDLRPGEGELALLWLGARLLGSACKLPFIVCDDYTHEGALSKQAPVRLCVDKACREGLVRDLGVYQWGTWFGQLT